MTTKKQTRSEVPAAACSILELSAPQFQFAESAGEPGAENPRAGFSMEPVASGKAILGHWYWGNLALDLEGVELPGRQIPALKDHDPDQRAGFTTELSVVDGVG
ncbi:MAG: hypothetical protein V2I33_24795, partial [Kangiellaceae bacterium]|nr:hypothetical protein [Kangiellaceae bacterium]